MPLFRPSAFARAGLVSLLFAAGSAHAQTIYPIDRADILEGALFDFKVEFPDKVRLQAPVLGEEITVCRNGNDVWAVPGAKVEHPIFTAAPATP